MTRGNPAPERLRRHHWGALLPPGLAQSALCRYLPDYSRFLSVKHQKSSHLWSHLKHTFRSFMKGEKAAQSSMRGLFIRILQFLFFRRCCKGGVQKGTERIQEVNVEQSTGLYKRKNITQMPHSVEPPVPRARSDVFLSHIFLSSSSKRQEGCLYWRATGFELFQIK